MPDSIVIFESAEDDVKVLSVPVEFGSELHFCFGDQEPVVLDQLRHVRSLIESISWMFTGHLLVANGSDFMAWPMGNRAMLSMREPLQKWVDSELRLDGGEA